MKQKKTYL